jgi:hypothetical protein
LQQGNDLSAYAARLLVELGSGSGHGSCGDFVVVVAALVVIAAEVVDVFDVEDSLFRPPFLAPVQAPIHA